MKQARRGFSLWCWIFGCDGDGSWCPDCSRRTNLYETPLWKRKPSILFLLIFAVLFAGYEFWSRGARTH